MLWVHRHTCHSKFDCAGRPANPPAQPPAAVATAVVVSPSSRRLPAIACSRHIVLIASSSVHVANLYE